jgi:hypothetical protein
MDRTNFFAALVAINVTSIVAFEYLHYTETRLEVQDTPIPTPTPAPNPTLITAVAEQSQDSEVRADQSIKKYGAPATPIATIAKPSQRSELQVDRSFENNQVPVIGLLAQRQSLISQSKEDQLRLRTLLTTDDYELHCSCDKHIKNAYLSWPWPCPIKHSKDDVVIKAGARPTLVSEFEHGPYEVLTLARRTIEYITRDQKDMDPQQLDAVKQFRLCSERSRVLEMLSKDDIRSDKTETLTQWLFEH